MSLGFRYLEDIFKNNQFPNNEIIADLEKKFNIDKIGLKYWTQLFVNRRLKDKKALISKVVLKSSKLENAEHFTVI